MLQQIHVYNIAMQTVLDPRDVDLKMLDISNEIANQKALRLVHQVKVILSQKTIGQMIID